MIVAAILLGLAANADNLTIGIAYGIQRRHIRAMQNVAVALATTAVTFAALLVGQELHRSVLSSVPNRLSGLMLILLAVTSLLRPDKEESKVAPAGAVGWVEIAFLSASLSINNIGLALAGGFADVPFSTALSSVLGFSIALLSAGQLVGERASRQVTRALTQAWIGNFVLLVAGLMVLLGA